MHNTTLVLSLIATVATPLLAQTGKKAVFVPAAYEKLEGTTKHTYPFGRDSAQLQILVNGDQLATKTAILQSLVLRPDGPFKSYSGYKKKYSLTVYDTTVSASKMTTSPMSNRGSSTGTKVYDAVLSLPAVKSRVQLPANWLLPMPFSKPYTLDVSKKNLLMHIATADSSTANTWDLDAVTIFDNRLRGEYVRVGERCVYTPKGSSNAWSMSLGVGTNCYVGGSLDITLRGQGNPPAGTWPLAILGFAGSVGDVGYPVDLGPSGMPGCSLLINPALAFYVKEQNGTWPQQKFAIPKNKQLTGYTLFTQALAGNSKGLLGAVTTDTYQVRLGPPVVPSQRDIQSIFYLASRDLWSMSKIAAYSPVVKLTGVFQ